MSLSIESYNGGRPFSISYPIRILIVIFQEFDLHHVFFHLAERSRSIL